jgi:hypothetical protein
LTPLRTQSRPSSRRGASGRTRSHKPESRCPSLALEGTGREGGRKTNPHEHDRPCGDSSTGQARWASNSSVKPDRERGHRHPLILRRTSVRERTPTRAITSDPESRVPGASGHLPRLVQTAVLARPRTSREAPAGRRFHWIHAHSTQPDRMRPTAKLCWERFAQHTCGSRTKATMLRRQATGPQPPALGLKPRIAGTTETIGSRPFSFKRASNGGIPSSTARRAVRRECAGSASRCGQGTFGRVGIRPERLW